MDKTFNISVKSKQAKNLSKNPYVCGNTDYRVAFDFDDDWNRYPIKTARFVAADGTPYEETVIDNQCKFPQIMDTFRAEVGVYAGDLAVTTPAVVECLRSIRSGTGKTPEVPEPDRYDVMMEAINADALRAEEAAAAAAESADEAAEEVQRTFDENMLIVRVWFEDGTYRASHTWEDISKEKRKGKPVFAATSDVTYLCYGQEGIDFIFASVERTPHGENEGFHSKRLVIHNNNTISITKETVEMQQGGVDEEQLDQAVQEALQEAKDSGLFNGKDGYTPVKGKDYFDGKDGDDGISPTVSVSKTGKATTISITDKNGTKTATINDGEDGKDAEGGEEGGGLPDGGEPHQMLVTDADGVAKWKPLDFYEETVVMLPETVVSPMVDDEGVPSSEFPLLTPFAVMPKGGDSYTVNWNGVDYSGVALTAEMDGISAVALGNAAMVGFPDATDNGHPYVLIAVPPEYSEMLGGLYGTAIPLDGSTSATISVMGGTLHKIPERFIPELPGKNSNLVNGKALGSLRSLYATDDDETPLGVFSIAIGDSAKAPGNNAFAFGPDAQANANNSYAFGHGTYADGQNAHAEGYETYTSGTASHVEGFYSSVKAKYAHAEGAYTLAQGESSHAEGSWTEAYGKDQHVQGHYNATSYTYAHIVGNGTADDKRSNAHTLDWNGNAWFAGTVEGTALILSSPDGSRWQITVDNTGALATAKL